MKVSFINVAIEGYKINYIKEGMMSLGDRHSIDNLPSNDYSINMHQLNKFNCTKHDNDSLRKKINDEECKPRDSTQISSFNLSSTFLKSKDLKVPKPFENSQIKEMYPLSSAKMNLNLKDNKTYPNKQELREVSKNSASTK